MCFTVTEASVPKILGLSLHTRISASTFSETHLFWETRAENCGLLSRLKLFYILTCLFSHFQKSSRSKFICQYLGFLTVEDCLDLRLVNNVCHLHVLEIFFRVFHTRVRRRTQEVCDKQPHLIEAARCHDQSCSVP